MFMFMFIFMFMFMFMLLIDKHNWLSFAYESYFALLELLNSIDPVLHFLFTFSTQAECNLIIIYIR
jgi:hypothetical protein